MNSYVENRGSRMDEKQCKQLFLTFGDGQATEIVKMSVPVLQEVWVMCKWKKRRPGL